MNKMMVFMLRSKPGEIPVRLECRNQEWNAKALLIAVAENGTEATDPTRSQKTSRSAQTKAILQNTPVDQTKICICTTWQLLIVVIRWHSHISLELQTCKTASPGMRPCEGWNLRPAIM